MVAQNTDQNPALPGMSLFDRLKYEDENRDWVFQTFEAPPEFEMIRQPRSAIIFGERGSGKTTLLNALAFDAYSREDGLPHRLLVHWTPEPPDETPPLLEKQANTIFDRSAIALLDYVMLHPAPFLEADEWVEETLIWFVAKYLSSNRKIQIKKRQRKATAAGKDALEKFLADPSEDIFTSEVSPKTIMDELVDILSEIGLYEVWVLVDSLEKWIDSGQHEATVRGLTNFLSALNMFEGRSFVYKLFLPSEIEGQLAQTSSVQRRRVDVHHLGWSKEKLLALLLKKLSFALDHPITSLHDICLDKNLETWLERCGGETPYGWLKHIRPLVAAYIEQGYTPIKRNDWHQIRRRHPPYFRLNKAEHLVTVGERKIELTSPQLFTYLSFLYDHAGQICERKTVYYRGYRNLDIEPRAPHEPLWESEKSLSRALESATRRLRETIEPDPDDPLYLITIRRRGLKLENVF